MRTSLSRCQFATLGVLARDPKRNRIAWDGCGHGSFGLDDDPAERPNPLLMQVPVEHRWPVTNTIKSLVARGLIKKTSKQLWWDVFSITKAGLSAYAKIDREAALTRLHSTATQADGGT